ncbi:hypothetical protein [Acinetobacter baumannii]|uniref:hypothetical protein n=1 Tax=Acinetobacter baumannii TaxID=470 RepID=UPI003D9AD20C
MLNEQQETNTENVQATEQTQTTPVDTATPPVESQTQEQKQPESETETKPDIPDSADAYKVEFSWKALISMHSSLMKITKLF